MYALDGIPNNDFLEALMFELVFLTLLMICDVVLWVSMELKKEILLVRTFTILLVQPIIYY